MAQSTSAQGRRSYSIRFAVCIAASLAGALVAGCSRSPSTPEFDNSKPVVLGVKTQEVASPSNRAVELALLKAKRQTLAIEHGLAPAARVSFAAEPAISGEVTLSKAQVLGRTFLYGSDLQYSSISDSEDDDAMLVQTMALGHVPVSFKVMGKTLQLIADQTYLFESNINHPSRLINEFPILREDNDTLTIGIQSASPVLVTVVGPSMPTPRSSWVRSIEFVPQGNYLLMETSIELANGKIAEFMESVFPRDTLVPEAAKPLLADPEREPLAGRYRFLSGDALYLDLPEGRTKTHVADRFPVDSSKVIEWYVTRNIPSEYLPFVQAGVEGWNRYSQKMWGRDFIKFRGLLPEGVKIGDPRYNVISWDSVPDATSAYESQASDPLTGLQSHSVIYLPYAWIKIGKEFWEANSLTQNEDANARLEKIFHNGSFLGRPLKVRCLQDAALVASLEAHRSPEVFANELLKQVLFHEVGHSLGLAHNFKGSLAFDPTDTSSLFSSSIMDYNQYQLEGGTYDSEMSSNGPLLEYDRQILSVLYNSGKDVASSDPVLPACDDEEADSYDGGVDPLCIRYDAGKDPTQELALTLQLMRDPSAKIRKTKSLPTAIEDTIPTLGEASAVTTKEQATEKISQLVKELQGVHLYYLASGAQSAAYMMKLNVRSLYVFKEGSLLEGYDENAMRARVAEALLYLANFDGLEKPVLDANAKVQASTLAWLQSTPYYQGLSTSEQTAVGTAIQAALNGLQDKIKSLVLPKVRGAVLGSLVRKEGAPFFFDYINGQATDYERLALETLKQALTVPLKGVMRPAAERLSAITALKTFSEIPEGADAIERVKSKIKSELPRVKSAQEREELRALVKALG